MMCWRIAAAAGIALAGATATLAQTESLADPAAPSSAKSVEVLPGLTATVVSLRRLPDTQIVQLDYRLENTGERTVNLEPLMVTGNGALSGIKLLDFVGGTVHFPGSASGCLCSLAPSDEALAAGATFEGWAWFMPPESLDRLVAVQFAEEMPILHVPLE